MHSARARERDNWPLPEKGLSHSLQWSLNSILNFLFFKLHFRQAFKLALVTSGQIDVVIWQVRSLWSNASPSPLPLSASFSPSRCPFQEDFMTPNWRLAEARRGGEGEGPREPCHERCLVLDVVTIEVGAWHQIR